MDGNWKQIFKEIEYAVCVKNQGLFQVGTLGRLRFSSQARKELSLENFKDAYVKEYGGRSGNVLYDYQENVLWFPSEGLVYIFKLPELTQDSI